MSGNVTAVLSQGVGYGVVVGIGAFFTLAMIGISMLQVCHRSIVLIIDAAKWDNRTNTQALAHGQARSSTPLAEMLSLD
jgi:hypothetical protein